MATFTDTIKLVLNLDVDKSASGGLKGIKDDIDNTDGAFSKLKTGAGGAFDFVKENAAGFALGAGAAVAGFAVKAIGDFQDVALGAGQLSSALGISTEEASRLQEVAGDVGINLGVMEKSIGRMNRAVELTPEKFEAAGVAIAHAKDGTVDVIGTFENVVDAINNIEDPTKRAAVAQDLLGRGWQDMSRLIATGADGIKASLAGVEDAKVMSPEQVAQAENFRDTMDDLQGVVESFTLEVGSQLVPMLSDLAGAVIPVVEAFGKMHAIAERVGDIPFAGFIAKNFLNPLNGLQTVAGAVGDAWDAVFGDGGTVTLSGDNLDDAAHAMAEASREAANLAGETFKSTDATKAATDAWVAQQLGVDGAADAGHRLRAMWGVLIPTTEEGVAAQKAVAEAAKESADRQKHLDDTMSAVNAKIQEQVDRLLALHDESVSAADATLAVDDAQRKFADSVAAATEVNKDAESTADDKTDAVNAERDAMIDAAKAAESKADADGKASGVAATATGKIDAFNTSLLNNAHFATPEAQAAIADYILEANGIPASKGTDIKAAIERGDFDTAAQLLAGLSATRRAAIQAEATNVSATEQQLANLARDRQMTIRTNSIANAPQGSNKAVAGGGDVAAGEPVWVGDKYGINSPSAELFVPNTAGHVYNQSQIKRHADGTPGGMAGGGGNVYVTVNVAPGANAVEAGRQIVDALLPYLNSGGGGRLAKAINPAA